jgi:hypothetical protein
MSMLVGAENPTCGPLQYRPAITTGQSPHRSAASVNAVSVSQGAEQVLDTVPACQKTGRHTLRPENRDAHDAQKWNAAPRRCRHVADSENAVTHSPTAGGWRRSFADRSQSQFADEIVLEATTLAKPIEGKPSVAAVLATASSIYEFLELTAEAQSAPTTYLQWRATAFEGMQMEGVTVLERDVSGKIVAAAIHPLGPVLRFAAEIRDRLAGVIPADSFLEESTCPTAALECGRQ